MKRILAIILSVIMVASFAGCNNAAKDASADTETTTSAHLKWKDRMASMSIPDSNKRIVIFQNFINFNKAASEGEKLAFENYGANPVTPVDDFVMGQQVKSYPISLLKEIWKLDYSGDLTVIDKYGNSVNVPSGELDTSRVAVLADGTGALKTSTSEIGGLKYIITPNKEALVFVEPEETISIKDLFTTVGWETTGMFYYVATDAYWCFTEKVESTEASEIRGTLSGAVNCNLSLDESMGGAGKINDLFFITAD